MLKIVRSAGDGLKWSQPAALRREFELHAGRELAATLKFRSMWGTLATAESGDGCWTFKRVGFWQNRASVRACGSDSDLALFTDKTWGGGGTLEFPDGRRFRATTNFWMTKFAFQMETDEPLIRFNYRGMFRSEADVEVLPAASRLPETPMLVLLGWYLAVMLHADGAAGTAT